MSETARPLPTWERAEGGITVGSLRPRFARMLAEGFAVRSYDGTPALDARLLIGMVLGIPASAVPLHDEEPVSAEIAARAVALAERRAAGEPVARIAGVKEFHGHDFVLSPDTLEPRPDTETLVDAVLASVPPEAAPTLLDLGTGTGAILLAILAARPRATGVGIDRAPGAIRTARENARRLGLEARAAFMVGDWSAAVGRQFDVLVANPPYVESAAIDSLAVEVRRHDPHLALDGGADGLDAVRAILADLDRILAPGGSAFVEIGAGQGPAVAKLAATLGFSATFRPDLSGIERVAVLRRKPSGVVYGASKKALGNQRRTG